MPGQRDKQTDRQKERLTERQTDRKKDSLTDEWINRQLDRISYPCLAGISAECTFQICSSCHSAESGHFQKPLTKDSPNGQVINSITILILSLEALVLILLGAGVLDSSCSIIHSFTL